MCGEPMLYKNTLIKIKKSLGRYLSLLMIVFIGVGFFAGLQATVPDMIALADRYYKENNLMDFKIVSTLGLTDEDAEKLQNLKGVKEAVPSYSLDVMAQDKAIRVHAIEDKVNRAQLVDGRMPKKDNECIADSKTYQVGDQIKITSDKEDELKNMEYTVVGTVQSVLYLAEDYGSTTVGDGKLASYIFINKDNFTLDAYTEIYVAASVTDNTEAYSKNYKNAASLLKKELVSIKEEREKARYQQIYNEAAQKISKNEAKLAKEKAKGEKKLADAKKELDENSEKLAKGKKELSDSETKLKQKSDKQEKEFEAAKAKIANGWKEINSALKQNGLNKEELNTKISELDKAIASMKTQLTALSPDSQEYATLSATLEQYEASYKGLVKLQKSITELTGKEEALNKGIKAFDTEITKAERKLKEVKNELIESENQLNDGYETYGKSLKKFNSKIAKAQGKLESARDDLSQLEQPQWYISDRDSAIGYNDLKSGIDVVASVTSVFPFFFILIGMLMTSNTMTRMIAEERGELGTLASLGYKDGHIAATYLFYVLTASGIGALTGFFTGCRVIPPLIFSNFQFILPHLTLQYNMLTFFIILCVTLTLMTLVTVVSCKRELRQQPSALMRPVPPKRGQTILLERIGLIWKHLSFTWKVTLRNMFRYKKRAIMTIVGVAGCTSLLLAGFGLRDSMNGVAQKQYQDIFRYSDMILLKEETKSISSKLERILTKEKVDNPLLIRQTAFTCEKGGKAEDLYLIVPENQTAFQKYYHLTEPAKEQSLTMENGGVIITRRLSEVFQVKKGDMITVKDSDNHAYTLLVTGVAQNYTSNYIYMSSIQYKAVFLKDVSYNAIVSGNHANEKTLAKNMIDSGYTQSVVFTSDVLKKALDSSESLNGIILLIVVVSSLLAIIVLYNLTSINISERTREIATLKVLGFTDGETNGYIYREAFLLTLLSIGIGLFAGVYLHQFIVAVIEAYSSLLYKKINLTSYLYAALMTLLFSVAMQAVTYFKLLTIDMIESLKSVE